MTVKETPPILADKHYDQPSVFIPENLLREARRQKKTGVEPVPDICVLDPDGDIVRRLNGEDRAHRHEDWACYHTDLHITELDGIRIGVIGCAVGASFAVLVAEQLFASGCRLLLSVTSSGQLDPVAPTPYFVLIDRALRDEGTSYHYTTCHRAGTAKHRRHCWMRSTLASMTPALQFVAAAPGPPTRLIGKRPPPSRWKPPHSMPLPKNEANRLSVLPM